MNALKYSITDQDNISYTIVDSSQELMGLGPEERIQLDSAKQFAAEIYQSAYETFHRKGDNLIIPEVLLSDSKERNFIVSKIDESRDEYHPVICFGLVKQLHEHMVKRYAVEDTQLLRVLGQEDIYKLQKRAFEYGIKFLALHELFHLWHGHDLWETNYYFSGSDTIVQGNGRALYLQYKPLVFSLSDSNKMQIKQNEDKFLLVAHYHLSHQSLEADADRSAIEFLVNEIVSCAAGKNIQEKKAYIDWQFRSLIAAILTVNNIFHHNERKQYSFVSLPKDMAEIDHPTPAIRFFLEQYEIVSDIEKQIKDCVVRQIATDGISKMIDFESDICKRDGEKYPFFATAYCNVGQSEVLNIRMRYNQILPSLKQYSACRLNKAYPPCDFKIRKEDILYSDSGEKL